MAHYGLGLNLLYLIRLHSGWLILLSDPFVQTLQNCHVLQFSYFLLDLSSHHLEGFRPDLTLSY